MIVGVLTGTTASGKSAVALQLAEKRDLEIISADSRQVYRGFRIGTGQPTRLEQSRVVHHFVDHLAPELHFSAGEFARSVVELEKRSPEKKRIIVGGTGFYLSALLFGLPPIPPVSADMRRKFKRSSCSTALNNFIPNFRREIQRLQRKSPRRMVVGLPVR